jgi:hypothetical protein
MLSTPGPTQRGNVCEWTHTDGIRKTLPRLHCRLWLPEFILPALELIADFWTTVSECLNCSWTIERLCENHPRVARGSVPRIKRLESVFHVTSVIGTID